MGHDRYDPMWFERRARDVAAGDFVIIYESDGPRPRIVRSVAAGVDGSVVVHCWNGSTDVGHVWPADHLVELM